MIQQNNYDPFFEEYIDENGEITIYLDSDESVTIFPFETMEGERLYQIRLCHDKTIYEIAEQCECEVVLVHIIAESIWDNNIEIIKETPKTIETTYDERHGYYGITRHSKYIIFSSLQEIKNYYKNISKETLTSINLDIPEDKPFTSSNYLMKMAKIIEDKIDKEWGHNLGTEGYYDDNYQFTIKKKIELSQLNCYGNEDLRSLFYYLDAIESGLKNISKYFDSIVYFLIGQYNTSSSLLDSCNTEASRRKMQETLKNLKLEEDKFPLDHFEISIVNKNTLDEFDSPHQCFLAIKPL